MPNKCSVPRCNGNYENNGPRVHIFSFPRDETLSNKWLRAIKRDHFKPSKNSRVSINVIIIVFPLYCKVYHVTILDKLIARYEILKEKLYLMLDHFLI